MTTSITIPSASDFHLHLRQGDMMRMVTPKVEEGGVSLAYIMVRNIKKNYYVKSLNLILLLSQTCNLPLKILSKHCHINQNWRPLLPMLHSI